MPNYRPTLGWLYVPDFAHLLVLADAYDPVLRSVRVLDLSLERIVRGVQVPIGRVPCAALLKPKGYPRTLLGEWKAQAWARWRIEKAERAARAKKDGPAPWRPQGSGPNQDDRRRNHARPNNRFLKHRR